MNQTSKWPAIDPVVKDWVIDYFSKCNKMGRPLRSEHIKTDNENVKDSVLYMPVWGPDENCWVDDEFISVRVFSYYDTPNKGMIVTVMTRSNEVDNLFYTHTTTHHVADAGDAEWLERLVRERR